MTPHAQSNKQLIQGVSGNVYQISEDMRESKFMWRIPNDQVANTLAKDDADMNMALNIPPSTIHREEHAFWQLLPETWRMDILHLIMSEHDVITKIRDCGLNLIAERLDYLRKLPIDSQYEKSIDLESLSNFAHFVMDNPKLPRPQITVSPDGFINAEWFIEEYGDLSVEFLSSGDIMFSILIQSSDASPKFTNGVQDMNEVMRIVKPFMDVLMLK